MCRPDAQVRLVTGLHKLKVAYDLKNDVETPHEVCFGCTIDAHGVAAAEDSAKIRTGGTCGGHPNGCAVLKVVCVSVLMTHAHVHAHMHTCMCIAKFMYTRLLEAHR